MENVVGNWNKRKDVEKDGKTTECATIAVMLDGETSNYVDIFTRSST